MSIALLSEYFVFMVWVDSLFSKIVQTPHLSIYYHKILYIHSPCFNLLQFLYDHLCTESSLNYEIHFIILTQGFRKYLHYQHIIICNYNLSTILQLSLWMVISNNDMSFYLSNDNKMTCLISWTDLSWIIGV